MQRDFNYKKTLTVLKHQQFINIHSKLNVVCILLYNI